LSFNFATTENRNGKGFRSFEIQTAETIFASAVPGKEGWMETM
jgi:hypothetical protein